MRCLQLMVLALLLPGFVLAGSVVRVPVQSAWEFSQVGKNEWLPAKVPGTVHTDLLENGEIPDPFYGTNEKGLQWIGYGPVPELLAYVQNSPYPKARVRHTIADPEMHLQLARAGAGIAVLPVWVEAKFPELQRVPGTKLDERRSIWVLLHSDLRRVRRVRLFVDYLCAALLERRAEFIGR